MFNVINCCIELIIGYTLQFLHAITHNHSQNIVAIWDIIDVTVMFELLFKREKTMIFVLCHLCSIEILSDNCNVIQNNKLETMTSRKWV